jgi:hypothetical protein
MNKYKPGEWQKIPYFTPLVANVDSTEETIKSQEETKWIPAAATTPSIFAITNHKYFLNSTHLVVSIF